MRSFLHYRLDRLVDTVEPSEEKLAEAQAHQEEIVHQLAAAVKKPDPRAVPVTDPANAAAFVAAVRAAAERWQVNLSTIVDIAARYEEEVRAAAGEQPTVQSLYDEAFAQLALGDFTASRFSARRAADLALKLLEQEPEFENAHREAATNALLLVHEAAKAAHDIPTAIAALEEAGSLIDKEADPLLWADVHEPLAKFLLEHAKWDRVNELISDLIDIREDHQGENHPALANTLLLWAELLNAQARYPAMESVAARAERILGDQTPINFINVATAMGCRARALKQQGRLEEAESLMRRSLLIKEQNYGTEHPRVGITLNNLATLLQKTNRLGEAEPLMRRALLITEQSYGAEHPSVAIDLNNLAQLLRASNRLDEAEPLMRRHLEIFFRFSDATGHEHPNFQAAIENYAGLLKQMGKKDDEVKEQLNAVGQPFGFQFSKKD